MSIRITEDCINCGSCEVKCPNKAIYEGGKQWTFSYGTDPLAKFLRSDGSLVGRDQPQEFRSAYLYYIVAEKCTECVGFHDEPQCVSVCPVDCCIQDEENKESQQDLLTKRERLKKQ